MSSDNEVTELRSSTQYDNDTFSARAGRGGGLDTGRGSVQTLCTTRARCARHPPCTEKAVSKRKVYTEVEKQCTW